MASRKRREFTEFRNLTSRSRRAGVFCADEDRQLLDVIAELPAWLESVEGSVRGYPANPPPLKAGNPAATLERENRFSRQTHPPYIPIAPPSLVFTTTNEFNEFNELHEFGPK